MRTNEICQLKPMDVKDVDDVLCFCNVCDSMDGKRLKSASAHRNIPVHPLLVEHGLIDFVNTRNTETIWNLPYSEKHGYGGKFTKWVGRFNRKYVTDDPKKVFNSTRHAFIDELRKNRVPQDMIDQLMGHSPQGSEGVKRYGSHYSYSELLESISNVDFRVSLKLLAKM